MVHVGLMAGCTGVWRGGRFVVDLGVGQMAKRKEVTGEIARHAARWEDGRVYVTITDDDGHSKMIGMIMPAVRVQGFKAMLDVEVSPRHRTLLRVGTVCKTRCAAERALRRAYKEG